MYCSRREFLISSVSAALALGQINQLVFAAESSPNRDVLVFVFLRGGYDALNVIAPVDDNNYKSARGTDTRIAEKGNDAGLHLTNAYPGFDFRIHAKAAPLKELYDEGELAFIHACGVPNGTRSHFDAQSLIERGTSHDNARALRSGWLTRHLSIINPGGVIPAVSSTESTPESLAGFGKACCISEIGEFAFQGHWKYGTQQQQLLRTAYQGKSPLATAGTRTLQTLDFINSRVKRDSEGNVLPYRAGKQAIYPSDDYAQGLTSSLQIIARLIKMDIGLELGLVDFDGWDTHQSQAYVFPNQLDALSRALHAFYTDLSDFKNRTTVVIMSEFGRRFKQNESAGTDHGHGSLMMVLGGNINGGRLLGTWPGLETEQLDQGVDLKVTSDYRSVLAEILSRRLNNPRIDLVFPDFKPTELGLIRV